MQQVNRGQWGCLAGPPLGALAQLLQDWLGAFREPVLTGAALHAVLRLGSALTEARPLLLRAYSNARSLFQPNLPNQCSHSSFCITFCSPLDMPSVKDACIILPRVPTRSPDL